MIDALSSLLLAIGMVMIEALIIVLLWNIVIAPYFGIVKLTYLVVIAIILCVRYTLPRMYKRESS